MNIEIRRIIISICLILMANSAVAEGTPQFGIVSGQAIYCGTGGKAGMRVYMPGRQYIVITGADGKFIFESMPSGTYSLNFELDSKLVSIKDNINVYPGRITDLGQVAVCQDIDGKVGNVGATTKSKKRKDVEAIECKADFQGVILVTNGRAQCDKGKITKLSCDKNFADCDKNSDNGCETDLMKDNDNCGSCGYSCGNLEICSLGTC